MSRLLTHIAQRRRLFRALLSSPWAGALRLAVEERLAHRVGLALDALAERIGDDLPPQRDEAVAVMSGGLVAAIMHWALIDDTDAEAYGHRIQALMPAWWPVR